MNETEFWNIYGITDYESDECFEETCEFLMQEQSDEFKNNDELAEVISCINDYHLRNKNIDNILKLNKIIREKYPNVYSIAFPQLSSHSVAYYNFQRDTEQVEKYFTPFLANPLLSFHSYMECYNSIFYYQQKEILKNIYDLNFGSIIDSNYEIPLPKFEFVQYLISSKLEEFYEKNNNEFDENEYISFFKEKKLKINTTFLKYLKKGIFQPMFSKEFITEKFLSHRKYCLFVLEGYFLKYMKEKNVGFTLSDKLWISISNYLHNKAADFETSPDDFFTFTQNEFDNFIIKSSDNFWSNNIEYGLLLIWGSVYLFDFLKKIDLISEETYNNFIEIAKCQKGIYISKFLSDMWLGDFIHTWEKPDSISANEFEVESIIFRKSYNIPHMYSKNLNKYIAEELKNIGELAPYIYDVNKKIINKKKSPNENMGEFIKEFMPKVGRNEPCPCGSGKKYKKCCGK